MPSWLSILIVIYIIGLGLVTAFTDGNRKNILLIILFAAVWPLTVPVAFAVTRRS